MRQGPCVARPSTQTPRSIDFGRWFYTVMKVQVRSGTVRQGTELKSYHLGDAIGPEIDLRKNSVKHLQIFFGGIAFGVLGRPTHDIWIINHISRNSYKP